jgi:hypothetical protein
LIFMFLGEYKRKVDVDVTSDIEIQSTSTVPHRTKDWEVLEDEVSKESRATMPSS